MYTTQQQDDDDDDDDDDDELAKPVDPSFLFNKLL